MIQVVISLGSWQKQKKYSLALIVSTKIFSNKVLHIIKDNLIQ